MVMKLTAFCIYLQIHQMHAASFMCEVMWLHLQMVASWFKEFNDEQKNILILQLLVRISLYSVFYVFAYILGMLCTENKK